MDPEQFDQLVKALQVAQERENGRFDAKFIGEIIGTILGTVILVAGAIFASFKALLKKADERWQQGESAHHSQRAEAVRKLQEQEAELKAEVESLKSEAKEQFDIVMDKLDEIQYDGMDEPPPTPRRRRKTVRRRRSTTRAR